MLLSVVGKYLILTARIFVANLSSALSFRASFFLHVLGVIIFDGGHFLLWLMFFKQFPSVGGWTISDLSLVSALFILSYALIDVFAGGVTELARLINAGSIDYFLVFPKPILWHIAVSRSDTIALGSIGLGIVFFWYSGEVTLIRTALFALATCFSIILMFNFFVIVGSIAFFVGGFEQGEKEARYLLATLARYSFSIFPAPFKYLLMTVIPSYFVITLPAQLVNAFSWTTCLTLTLVSIGASLFAYWFFMKGLQRYESGNLVSVRI